VVVALKSRTAPVQAAVGESLAALAWLQGAGAQQIYFKYCSTFDSTPSGNIGPVADALLDALGSDFTVVCPAFPATGRSIYQGHLFVTDRLLSESGMQNHPLTPMTDPDIRRWLGYQVKGSVGHIPAQIVMQGADATRTRMRAEDAAGHRLLVADAITDSDLITLGQAAADLPLLTGGSGIAMGLPGNFRDRGLLSLHDSTWTGQAGRAAILSGSCSNATRAQVAQHAKTNPVLEVTADQVMAGDVTAQGLADWALAQQDVPLIYTSADPAVVAEAQTRFGKQTVAEKIEAMFAELARALVKGGITRLVTAGGETSGAVVEGLGLSALQIGPEIDPGVPMIRASDNLVLALKSGNFGGPDFFARAAAMMEGTR
jgi:uncharacterized protein YgbK (DUF1537 family)